MDDYLFLYRRHHSDHSGGGDNKGFTMRDIACIILVTQSHNRRSSFFKPQCISLFFLFILPNPSTRLQPYAVLNRHERFQMWTAQWICIDNSDQEVCRFRSPFTMGDCQVLHRAKAIWRRSSHSSTPSALFTIGCLKHLGQTNHISRWQHPFHPQRGSYFSIKSSSHAFKDDGTFYQVACFTSFRCTAYSSVFRMWQMSLVDQVKYLW